MQLCTLKYTISCQRWVQILTRPKSTTGEGGALGREQSIVILFCFLSFPFTMAFYRFFHSLCLFSIAIIIVIFSFFSFFFLFAFCFFLTFSHHWEGGVLGRGTHWEGGALGKGEQLEGRNIGRGEPWVRYSTKSVQKSNIASDSKPQCLVLTEETHKY